MRAIFTKSLVDKALFNTVVCGSNETYNILENIKLESTEILEIRFFFF